MKFGKILVSIYQPGSAAILNSIPGLEVIEGLGIDRLLCLTLNTNDSLNQFSGQIFPKFQLKCEGFSYITQF